MSNLREHFNYAKFAKKPYKVLVINTGYFLLKEFCSAMVEKGHKVKQVKFYDCLPANPFIKSSEQFARADFLADFLQSAIEFQPDFVFTVNMLGFDAGGTLLEMLEQLSVPVLNWFVDTPFGILSEDVRVDYHNILSLCWERNFIQPFRNRFSKHRIEYMPYGTALTGREKLSNPDFANQISFVGSSMHYGVSTWRETATISPSLEKEFTLYIKDSLYTLPKMLEDFFREFRVDDRLQQTFFYFLGSKLYRENMVKCLSPGGNFAVYGDDGWRKSGINNLKLFPSLDYYRETPQLFYNSKININITSPQMATAVNQRVFDIPAAGGFLLTDFRSDLQEIFGDGFTSFSSTEELKDLGAYYLRHDSVRSCLAAEMQSYVLANHRYANRLESIFYLLLHGV